MLCAALQYSFHFSLHEERQIPPCVWALRLKLTVHKVEAGNPANIGTLEYLLVSFHCTVRQGFNC
jgi:hypothetical protein